MSASELLALARERFPVGCRVRYNASALTTFQRKAGQRFGTVSDQQVRFAKELGKLNVNVKVLWGGEGHSHVHPCWLEKI